MGHISLASFQGLKYPQADIRSQWVDEIRCLKPMGMASVPPLMMKLATPVSPYPSFPRKREKGQTNRCASFTLTRYGSK
jgi:hypothetical protein